MELRMGMARTSLRPLVWIAVLVCAVALAVVAVYAVTPRPVAHAPGYYITTVSGFPGPDAQDRNEQFSQSRDPEAHHGH